MDKGEQEASSQEKFQKDTACGQFITNSGMEKGAGDGAGASSSAAADRPRGSVVRTDAQRAALLQKHLSTLHLSKSAHDINVTMNSDELNFDEDEDVASTDDEDDEVEPLCSYPYGYLKRQTVYVCVTCNDPSKEDWTPAGVCIGCRHACHQGHEVISMETRRNFRCDCGNKKFPEGSQCVLCPTKEDVNEHNVYNNNYKGTFCTCNCKEAECVEEDPLYQCVVCEDWFHASHCNVKTNGIEKNYTDLVCGDCTSKLDFLRYYEPFDPTVEVTEDAIEEMMKYTDGDMDEEDDDEDEGKDSVNNNTVSTCKLDTLVKKDPYQKGHLWTLGWRGNLCRCAKCKAMYGSLNVSFLLDREDETRRYFDDEEDDTHEKICSAIQKFEEWLLKMDPNERDEMFTAGPAVVKSKLKEHFAEVLSNSSAEEGAADTGERDDTDKLVGLKEFLMDDQLLDQLLQAFMEFVLDADGGTDYLLDVDAFHKIFAGGPGPRSAAGAGDHSLEDTGDEDNVGDNSILNLKMGEMDQQGKPTEEAEEAGASSHPEQQQEAVEIEQD